MCCHLRSKMNVYALLISFGRNKNYKNERILLRMQEKRTASKDKLHGLLNHCYVYIVDCRTPTLQGCSNAVMY